MSENKPVIAQKAPYAADVEEGKAYWWCSCGKSGKQPFCDGAHKGSAFAPTKFMARKTERVWFCGCKHSAAGALCDGTHKKL